MLRCLTDPRISLSPADAHRVPATVVARLGLALDFLDSLAPEDC
jgi:hypothetical protein